MTLKTLKEKLQVMKERVKINQLTKKSLIKIMNPPNNLKMI
jgi:hypothetical protein